MPRFYLNKALNQKIILTYIRVFCIWGIVCRSKATSLGHSIRTSQKVTLETWEPSSAYVVLCLESATAIRSAWISKLIRFLLLAIIRHLLLRIPSKVTLGWSLETLVLLILVLSLVLHLHMAATHQLLLLIEFLLPLHHLLLEWTWSISRVVSKRCSLGHLSSLVDLGNLHSCVPHCQTN